ncbi:MAG TPA: glycosyltransferase [Acidimicrobiales bacterium]|nr:glycosyltransferase [Acidimicrobiales bacterium]
MTPQNEENPYLPQLRKALHEIGVDSDWLATAWTPSQTLNTLLSPFELVVCRLRGFNLIHLHWVYKFSWWWTRRLPLVNKVPRWWFAFMLWFANAIGFRIVYTSHEPLPLAPAFDDDRAGRRPLLRRSRVVITITEDAKRCLSEFFGVDPKLIEVIPEGAPALGTAPPREDARKQLGVPTATPLVAMFGHLDPYKGVDLLLEAILELPSTTELCLRLLGKARDSEYAMKLDDLVRRLNRQGRDARWDNGVFPDEELNVLLSAADLVAIPFRWITNSTSLRVAMSRRVPVLVPDLPELRDVPAAAVFRYDHSAATGLRDELAAALRASPKETAARVAAAYEWTTAWTWHDVAVATKAVYERALQVAP